MDTFFRFDLINFGVLFVFVLNTIFGLVVLSRDTKNWTNRWFFAFTITITGWCLSMVLYRGFSDIGTVTMCARLLYVSAVLIPLMLIYFGETFPAAENGLKMWQKFILPLPTLALIIASLVPGGLIQFITLVPGGENVINFNFPVELCYVFYISAYFLYFFLILNRKFSYAYTDGVLHQQLFYIFLGTFLSATIGVVSNLLLLMLGNFSYNWLGQVGLIFMITLITFAILRYHLFNAKVISVELVVGSIWMFVVIRIYFATNPADQIINIAFLVVMIIIGVMLIGSVRKEVALRENLETANAGQTNLIHIMNHQIKGYLGKDKNIFAELLTDDYGAMPEAAKALLAQGLADTDAGVKYVTDILRGASAESGTLPYDMQPIDFKGIVLAGIENEKDTIAKKGLVLAADIADADYHTKGDAVQLAEAVRNLIENALYYTPSGKISVSLGLAKGMIRFAVTDTGVGVKSEDASKLFKAGGVSADSIKVNVKSSGYGLAFVKGVAEAHHGKVGFHSAGAGRGSTFFMELPIIRA